MDESRTTLTLSPDDYDDLRTAFAEADPRIECYLDIDGAEVIWCSDREVDLDEPPAPDAPDWKRKTYERRMMLRNSRKGRFLEIPPHQRGKARRDMKMFLDDKASTPLRAQFQDAPTDQNTYLQFEDALEHHPEDRRRWTTFHRRRLRERIDEWLDLHGYELVVETPEAT